MSERKRLFVLPDRRLSWQWVAFVSSLLRSETIKRDKFMVEASRCVRVKREAVKKIAIPFVTVKIKLLNLPDKFFLSFLHWWFRWRHAESSQVKSLLIRAIASFNLSLSIQPT
jgi:hypothetical protein